VAVINNQQSATWNQQSKEACMSGKHEAVLALDGESLQIGNVEDVARRGRTVELESGAAQRVVECRAWVDQVVARGQPVVYGVNTGFGLFANVNVDSADAAALSRNLILSHSVGVGEPLPEEVVRAAMLVRANTLALGHSGVTLQTLNTLLAMLNAGVHPVVPEIGSLGASGDLAPLSHLVLVLSRGENDSEENSGLAIYRGQRMSGKQAMQAAGIERVVLGAKEGLALNNGATFSAAMGALLVADSERLVRTAEIAMAMSLEAVRGVSDAFDERLHRARRHAGQIATAAQIRRLVADSSLIDAGGRVQDAYSLRCTPQVVGAVRQIISSIHTTIEDEINAATDNPLLFLDLPGENKALSGGNFHGEPVAFGMDFLSIALAEVAGIAERRIFRLTDPNLNDELPAMLVEGGGLNSGFMLAQYSAAALVADNKVLAHPDSVDSIPTSADQEDHISNSMNAARHAWQILRNVERVVGIELVTAAQALDFRVKADSHVKLGKGTAAAYARIRHDISHLDRDRLMYPDLDRGAEMVHNGEVLRAVEEAMGGPME
jgi:histidine ammonia-lyase